MAKLGDGSENIFDLDVNGNYYWELLFDIDNSNNAGTIKREVQVVTDVSLSYANMVRSLETETTSASLGFDLGGTFFEVVNVGVKGELSYEVKSEYENMSRSKKDYRKTTTKTDTFEVGPHSSLKMYRLAFQGPGVSYLTDTLSTNTTDMPAVPISIKVKLVDVLKDVEVVATDDSASRPDDLIQEAKGLNPDINSGFGGRYVWLRAVWTKNVDEGATGIQIAVQPEENRDYVDMAAGAGGDYRYLKMLRDPHSKQRITQVDLWRVNNEPPVLPTEGQQYQFMTDDINRGEGEIICIYVGTGKWSIDRFGVNLIIYLSSSFIMSFCH